MRARAFLATITLATLLAAGASAQSPSPSASSSPSASATKPPAKASPAPTPSPTPSTADLISSLNQADLQAAMTQLKNNFTNPDALTETELNRATLAGLVSRSSRGVLILPAGAGAPAESPFYSELIENHIGYLRVGSLTSANLQAMDKKLAEFAGKKVDALIVDLRSSPLSNDFSEAAEFAKRFAPKGKTLFSLRKPNKQERAFTADRDPAYQGTLMILADGDTAGPAEAVAGAIRYYDKALIIGQTTAGRAAEYSDVALPSGKILRLAVAEVVLPENRSLFPDGVKPDLPVEMSAADKRQIFQASMEKGISSFIYEAGRPHMNEAALLAGTNPDLDAAEAAQRRGRSTEKSLYDSVLQRAVDLVTSLAVYQKR